MADYNFSNCTFDVTKFGTDKKIQEVYPELLSYPDILSISQVAQKVGILITDMGSPFVSIKDHKYKVESIFKFLATQYPSVDFADETVLQVKHEIINYEVCQTMDMCSFLLEYQNHHYFTAWFNNNILYYSLSRRLATPKGDNESEDKYYDTVFKTQERAEKIGEKLKEQEALLFGSEAMKIAMFRSKKKRIVTYAEKYAVPNQTE